MKYIRTKDGIFEVILISPLGFVRIDKRDGTFPDIFEKNIVNQADTIEELCDVFIYVKRQDDKVVWWKVDDHFFTKEISFGGELYGAIWTDKGLIYVTKMNEERKLCLI